MGSFDLPPHPLDVDRKHFLVCDFTWALRSGALEEAGRYTRRQLKENEDLEHEALESTDHVFAFSEYVRDNLINHYSLAPERVTTVGSGFGEVEPFAGQKDYEDGHILFVAKVRPEEKGLSLLLDAFRLARRSKPELRLVLAGHESYKAIGDHTPGVTGYGHLAWADLQHLFRAARLFAMPAPCEPWGVVYIEALLSKSPVLGLNRAALPEITCHGRYGFLVDEPTAEAVAACLLGAVSDPHRLRAMGEAGQQHCLSVYSWDRVAAKVSSVISGQTEQ